MTVRARLRATFPTLARKRALTCAYKQAINKVCSCVLLLLLPLTTMADFQAGLEAYNAGDYATALQEWKAAAATPPVTIDSAIDAAIHAETHYAIGTLYWTGQGVTKDYFEAVKWMRKAAELGHARAQTKLGYLYSEGIAVQQDYAQAFEWFAKAARQGDVDGQYNLGIHYLNGWGVKRDNTMAAQYLAAASAQGDEAAEETLQMVLASNAPADDPCKSPLAGDCLKSPPAPDCKSPPAGDEQAERRCRAQGRSYNQDQTHSYNWLLEQNPSHYTIQVIALRSLSQLHSLIEGFDHLAPFATYTVELKGKPLHVLVQGAYPDVESARRARDNFPRAINRKDRVWIRQFARIQQIIMEQVSRE